MWGRTKDEQSNPDTQPAGARQGLHPGVTSAPPAAPSPSEPEAEASSSRMGESVRFKGEIHSDEDLLVDGSVEGSIMVPKHSLVLGPKSKVQATIEAKSILIHGHVRGELNASDRLTIAKAGRFEGNLITRRLEIHDGAVFVGNSAVHEAAPAPPAPRPSPAAPPQQAEAAAREREAGSASPNRPAAAATAAGVRQRPVKVKP